MIPQTLSAAARSLGPTRKGLAIGVWGSVSSVTLLAAPLGGGLLLIHGGWPSIFWVNLPLALLALVSFVATVPADGPPAAPASRDVARRCFPAAHVALFACSIGLVLLSLDSALQVRAIGLTGEATGIIGLAWWVRRERDLRFQQSCIVGRKLLENSGFMRACLAAGVTNATMFGGIVIVSLAIARMSWTGQDDALWAGYLYAPAMVAIALAMPSAGALAQSRSRATVSVVMAGAGGLIASPLLLALVLRSQPFRFWLAAAPLLLEGVAAGVLISYASFGAISAVAPEEVGLASGAISMSRNIGRAIGAAIFTSIAGRTGSTDLALVGAALLSLWTIPFALRYAGGASLGRRARPGSC
jgi:MFS family permease